MNRRDMIAANLKSGELSIEEFEGMLECAYDTRARSEQLLLQAAAERAGQKFEAVARAVSDRML